MKIEGFLKKNEISRCNCGARRVITERSWARLLNTAKLPKTVTVECEFGHKEKVKVTDEIKEKVFEAF